MREKGKLCAFYVYGQDLCFGVIGYHCHTLGNFHWVTDGRRLKFGKDDAPSAVFKQI